MSDPREPEDTTAEWARPAQPSADPTGSSASDEPHQQPWQPPAPRQPQQHWHPQAPQNWPPAQYPGQQYPQQWPQPPAGPGQPYYGGQPYNAGQPYNGGQPYYAGQPYGAGAQQPAPRYGEVPPSTGTDKPSRAPLYVVLALVVVGLAGAAVYFLTSGDTLDRQAAENGVAQVLTGTYGLENVTDVSCPSGRQVQKNDSFTCTVTIDGENRDVTITFVDDEGTYEVGRPN